MQNACGAPQIGVKNKFERLKIVPKSIVLRLISSRMIGEQMFVCKIFVRQLERLANSWVLKIEVTKLLSPKFMTFFSALSAIVLE